MGWMESNARDAGPGHTENSAGRLRNGERNEGRDVHDARYVTTSGWENGIDRRLHDVPGPFLANDRRCGPRSVYTDATVRMPRRPSPRRPFASSHACAYSLPCSSIRPVNLASYLHHTNWKSVAYSAVHLLLHGRLDLAFLD